MALRPPPPPPLGGSSSPSASPCFHFSSLLAKSARGGPASSLTSSSSSFSSFAPIRSRKMLLACCPEGEGRKALGGMLMAVLLDRENFYPRVRRRKVFSPRPPPPFLSSSVCSQQALPSFSSSSSTRSSSLLLSMPSTSTPFVRRSSRLLPRDASRYFSSSTFARDSSCLSSPLAFAPVSPSSVLSSASSLSFSSSSALLLLPSRRHLSLFSPLSLRRKGSSAALSSSSFSPSLGELRQAGQEAETHRQDPRVQHKYLACLNARGDHAAVVQRFEENRLSSKPFAVNEDCLAEYLKALSYTGQIHSRNLQQLTAIDAASLHSTHSGSALPSSSFSSFSSSPDDFDAAHNRNGKLDHSDGEEASSSSSFSARAAGQETPSSRSSPAGPASSFLGLQTLQSQQVVLSQQINEILRHLLRQQERETAGRASFSPAGKAMFLRKDGEGGQSEKAEDQAAKGMVDHADAKKRNRGVTRVVFGSVWKALKAICRGVFLTLKTCLRGVWAVLLSPIMAVFVLWSLVTDGVESFQQSAKRLEGGGLPDGSLKSKDWLAGKVVQPSEVKTSFSDVKGCEEVKKEVEEVVAYLRSPERFTAMGAHLPKGVLLQGPPGTGKTLLARAIAGEAGVPFIHASGSEFEEMYVGVGASRLRQLFAEARRISPCILFIDEIDALGGRRTLTENKHHRQTLNQLLTELDGFKPSDGVTLICATNLAEALDPALTRPGRIDRIIHVPFPSKKERIEILEHHSAKMPLAPDVDLDTLACLTSGMTGADLANLLNFAAIRAATEGKDQVTLAEVEESFDRLMVGNRRTGVVMKEEERRLTAYHESGHALLALYTPHSLPLHKATILFRGSSLGVTWSVGKEDSYSTSQQQYLASLDVAMGGKAAEELIFGEGNVTSGCHSDLVRATQLARRMVMDYGMGVADTHVPMVIGKKEYDVVSEGVKQRVDQAVQKLLDESYTRARNLLQDKREELQRLAEALLEHETLSADEIRAAVAGSLKREKPSTRRQNELYDKTKSVSELPPRQVRPGSGKEGSDEGEEEGGEGRAVSTASTAQVQQAPAASGGSSGLSVGGGDGEGGESNATTEESARGGRRACQPGVVSSRAEDGASHARDSSAFEPSTPLRPAPPFSLSTSEGEDAGEGSHQQHHRQIHNSSRGRKNEEEEEQENRRRAVGEGTLSSLLVGEGGEADARQKKKKKSENDASKGGLDGGERRKENSHSPYGASRGHREREIGEGGHATRGGEEEEREREKSQ